MKYRRNGQMQVSLQSEKYGGKACKKMLGR